MLNVVFHIGRLALVNGEMTQGEFLDSVVVGIDERRKVGNDSSVMDHQKTVRELFEQRRQIAHEKIEVLCHRVVSHTLKYTKKSVAWTKQSPLPWGNAQ